jgi:hypothetical protein
MICHLSALMFHTHYETTSLYSPADDYISERLIVFPRLVCSALPMTIFLNI